jgi:membrane fusion protein
VTLFRPEASAPRRRLWGEVKVSQSPPLMLWTLIALLTGAVIIGLLVFGRYTRKETVSGYLIPAAGVVQVTTPNGGRIARVLVEEGASVEAGAPLIEMTSDVGAVDRGPMLDVRLEQTDQQLAALGRREAAVTQAFAAESDRLRRQLGFQADRRSKLQRQCREQEQAVALSEADLARFEQLRAQGFAPLSEVDRRRRAVLAERNALAVLEADLAENGGAMADTEALLSSLPVRKAEALAQLQGERGELTQKRAELEVARGYVIRAPVAGVVSALQARPGLSPAAGTPLLAINPSGSELEALLLAPPRSAGFLRVGQLARLQVDAYPFQRFGFVEGSIRSIATSVIRPDELLAPDGLTEPVYAIRVKIAKPTVIAYGSYHTLRPGMTLKADLPIDRRTLWQHVFDPLLAAKRRSID